MKHKYLRVKNLITAILVCVIYQSYIVPSVPVLTEIFGCVFVVLTVMLILEYLDHRKRARIKARKEKSAPGGNPNALKN